MPHWLQSSFCFLAQPTHRRVVRHNTDVPVGSEKTDKFTAISLELAF